MNPPAKKSPTGHLFQPVLLFIIFVIAFTILGGVLFLFNDKDFRAYFFSHSQTYETKQSPSQILSSQREKLPYYKRDWAEDYPEKISILTLEGSWQQMGRQYGRGGGGYIRLVFDGLYQQAKDMGVKDRDIKETINEYKRNIFLFSPQMLDFMEGIAQGAKESLDRSFCPWGLNHQEKILFINLYPELLKKNINMDYVPIEGTLWTALPVSTSKNYLITGNNRDMEYFPLMYQITLRCYPEEEGTIPFVMTNPAGWIGCNNNINEKGLFLAYTGVHSPGDDLKKDEWGIPVPVISTYTVSRCATPGSARDLIIFGTEEYRQKTGNKTLLPSSSANYLLAGGDCSLVVEKSPHFYAIRLPGDMNEENEGYIAVTNHFSDSPAHDIRGRKTGTPMNSLGYPEENPSYQASLSRLRSALHQLKVYHKKMNFQLGKYELCCLRSCFDEKEIEHLILRQKGEKVRPSDIGWSLDNRQFRQENGKDILWKGTAAAFINVPALGVYISVIGSPSKWSGNWIRVNVNRQQGPHVLPE